MKHLFALMVLVPVPFLRAFASSYQCSCGYYTCGYCGGCHNPSCTSCVVCTED